MEFNRKDFKNVCLTECLGDEMFQRTKKVYEFLKTQDEPLFPIEIAKATGFVFHSRRYGFDSIEYHKVVKPLHWLHEMGLIDRIAIEEKVTITCDEGEGFFKEETMEYNGRIWTTSYWVEGKDATKEITSVRYKWFAK